MPRDKVLSVTNHPRRSDARWKPVTAQQRKKKRVEECANTALVLPFCFYRPGHLKVQAEGGGGVNLMAPPLLGTLILYVREGNAVVSDP